MRRADWEAALSDYLTASVNARFAWGELDCALFAAGAVRAMTGIDFAAPFRGRYRTARGSVRALRRYGAGSLVATVEQLLGEVPIGFARRGDIVLHGDERTGALGVCIGGDALFVGRDESGDLAHEGLVRIPRHQWSRAWAV